MKAQEKIVDALSQVPLCDDCLSEVCSINPRQQVNQRCSYLLDIELLTRTKELCPRCGKFKLINRLKQGAAEHLQRRRSPSIPIDPEKIKPIIEEGIRKGKVIVDPPADGLFWFWEGRIQERIIEHLIASGYTITHSANTQSREPGKDIEALSGAGRPLWITVKGYPRKSEHTQARHWFAESLFDLILWREEGKAADFAIGLPDSFATYRNLAGRITWLKGSLPFHFYWVREDGAVLVE